MQAYSVALLQLSGLPAKQALPERCVNELQHLQQADFSPTVAFPVGQNLKQSEAHSIS